jgi:CPA2 family monovalent cation:H+ antiporter-2
VLVVAAIALGTAWLVNQAGVSLELGAFLAGLVVSESEYSEQALSEVLPFRFLFNAVFFVSVGMLLDLSFLWQEPLLLLGAVVGVLLLKAVVATGTVLALGYPVRMATMCGWLQWWGLPSPKSASSRSPWSARAAPRASCPSEWARSGNKRSL